MRSIEKPDPGEEPAVEETPLAGESPSSGACADTLPAAAVAAPSAWMGASVPAPASSADRANLGPRAIPAKGDALPEPNTLGVRPSGSRGPCMKDPGDPRSGPAGRPGEFGGGARREVGERLPPAGALGTLVTAGTSVPNVPLRRPPAEPNGAPMEPSAPPASELRVPVTGEMSPPPGPFPGPTIEPSPPVTVLVAVSVNGATARATGAMARLAVRVTPASGPPAWPPGGPVTEPSV